MISTNFITGTGFIKCIPITLSGREVTAAIFVIEIEEVLVAKIASGLAALSSCSKILNFKLSFSVAASTIKSAVFTPSSVEVKRSEEHTSELQSRPHLVCRLLLEKKKTYKY